MIDGNSLMHRAFHAVPLYMTSPDGRPTNACFGFLSMLLKLADDFSPDGIVCAFDHGIPAFRLEAVELYKAHRPPTDPDLKVQFPMVKQLLVSMGIPVVELDGWEGDDILGTLAARGEQDGMKCLLVTGDKDALQLASEHTSIINTRSGMTDVVIYDPAAVVEKWGVGPDRVPDFLGLMGDSSDNIPGVPGVGPKTATKLLQTYGTLEDVLAHAGELQGKLGEKVRDNADQARASRKVATIIRDLPIDCNLADVRFPAFDAQKVTETFRELALTSQLKKVLALIGKKPTATSSSSAELSGLEDRPLTFAEVCTGEEALAIFKDALAKGEEMAVLVEARTGDSLFDSDRLCYIATKNSIMVFDDGAVDAVCADLVRTGRIITSDSKALFQELLPPNSAIPAAIEPRTLDSERVFDLSLAAYLLDSSWDYSERELLFSQFLPDELPAPTDELPRGAIHVTAFHKLVDILRHRLSEDHSIECFTKIEMPLVPVLVRMERWGMNVDSARLAELNKGIAADIAALRSQAIAEAGEEFNLDSPRQLGAILFEKLKLPPVKKTRTGYSTDAAVLQEIRELHPLPGIMLEYRELAKLKSTY
ncbi:MAG: DNA polymerase I, partial [Coriobacteriales bacterium]|nr:DNA polymerase I [Coriobacteriales bacterium]